MRTVDIERVIAAPIDEVFTFLTDSANYKHVPGVLSAILRTPGTPQPQGVGAIRVVTTPLLRLTEQVVTYEPPHLMRYNIVKSIPPLRHDGGSMTFTEVETGTHVRWQSRFEIDSPILSNLLALLIQPIIAAGFRIVLRTADQRLRA